MKEDLQEIQRYINALNDKAEKREKLEIYDIVISAKQARFMANALEQLPKLVEALKDAERHWSKSKDIVEEDGLIKFVTPDWVLKAKQALESFTKTERAKILANMMAEDEKDGLYNQPKG